MLSVLKLFVEEVSLTVRKPRRLSGLLDEQKRRKFRRYAWKKITDPPKRREDSPWETIRSKPRFRTRAYSSYQAYVRHQKGKLPTLDLLDLSDYDVKYRDVLRKRLKTSDILLPGMSVLCLGARLGTEVKAFLDLGCFAIGIDLNPGEKNRYVVHGDFHEIQYAPGSIDLIFTNSLDHVRSIETVIGEIKRLLKPNGALILEVCKGTEEEGIFSSYESFAWAKIGDLVAIIEGPGFRVIREQQFEYPWHGKQICLRKA